MSEVEQTIQPKVRKASRTQSVAFVGLTIAIMAVSAWVTIPLGPVPFTLQMFAFTFALIVLTPRQSMAAVAGYLALGAIGVPVFSAMRGGIGVLAGPTGGFLWGYLLGAAAAALLLWATRGVRQKGTPAAFVLEVAAGLLFTAIAYVCGWMQFMAVAAVGPVEAFAVSIAPYIVVDVLKVVAAVVCARAVRAALPRR